MAARRLDREQLPALNGFLPRDGGTYHSITLSLLCASKAAGHDERHVDSIWPVMFHSGRGFDSTSTAYEIVSCGSKTLLFTANLLLRHMFREAFS
jgi:hypothetical protein